MKDNRILWLVIGLLIASIFTFLISGCGNTAIGFGTLLQGVGNTVSGMGEDVIDAADNQMGK